MTGYLLRRTAASLLLVFLLISLLFLLLHLAPGKPGELFVNPRASPERQQQLIALYGLDRPLGEQYLAWISAVALSWDWGVSYSHGRPVTRVLAEALPNTLLLALTAFALDLSLALVLSLLAARRRESGWDHAIRGGSMLLFAVPVFWLGLMAILLFSYVLPIFPAGHMLSPGASEIGGWRRLTDLLWHLALPATVLGLASFGGTVRLLRSSLLDILDQDYVRTARAKGLSERRVLLVHALRNAAVPILQLAAVSLPLMLNGSLALEVVFSWPGVGRILQGAVLAADYPLILAGTALSGFLVVAGSLAADLLHAVLDPRVRHA